MRGGSGAGGASREGLAAVPVGRISWIELEPAFSRISVLSDSEAVWSSRKS